jgi:hypothetical protein
MVVAVELVIRGRCVEESFPWDDMEKDEQGVKE